MASTSTRVWRIRGAAVRTPVREDGDAGSAHHLVGRSRAKANRCRVKARAFRQGVASAMLGAPGLERTKTEDTYEREEIVHVPMIIPQARIIQQSVEVVTEVPVPETQEESVQAPTIVHQSRHNHIEVEQIAHILFSHEQDVHVPKVFAQERLIQLPFHVV